MADFEILFGGYATPTKCEAFWRLALNSYNKFKLADKIPFKASIATLFAA